LTPSGVLYASYHMLKALAFIVTFPKGVLFKSFEGKE
jgi:hypothetical protein